MHEAHPQLFAPNITPQVENQTALYSVEELQQELIQSLPVYHFSEHPDLPKDLIPFLSAQTKENSGDISYEDPATHSEFLIRTLSKNVSYVVCTDGRDYKISEGKYVFDVAHIFIFDSRTGNIADLRHFWTNHPQFNGAHAPTVATGTNYYENSDVPASLIALQKPFVYLPYLRGADGIDFSKTKENLRIIAAPHELGHFLQINEAIYKGFQGTFGEAIVESDRRWRKLLKKHILNSILPFGKKYQEAKGFKQDMIKKERNAHAFVLNLFRNLRSKGIDLSEKFPEMISGVNEALGTYDRVMKYVAGGKFTRARPHKN